jgi:hypothetical protein
MNLLVLDERFFQLVENFQNFYEALTEIKVFQLKMKSVQVEFEKQNFLDVEQLYLILEKVEVEELDTILYL